MVQPSFPSPHYSAHQYCIMKIIAPETEILICPVFFGKLPVRTCHYLLLVVRESDVTTTKIGVPR